MDRTLVNIVSDTTAADTQNAFQQMTVSID